MLPTYPVSPCTWPSCVEQEGKSVARPTVLLLDRSLLVSRAQRVWFQRVYCSLCSIDRNFPSVLLNLPLWFPIDGMAPYVRCWRRVLSGTFKDEIPSSAKPLVVATWRSWSVQHGQRGAGPVCSAGQESMCSAQQWFKSRLDVFAKPCTECAIWVCWLPLSLKGWLWYTCVSAAEWRTISCGINGFPVVKFLAHAARALKYIQLPFHVEWRSGGSEEQSEYPLITAFPSSFLLKTRWSVWQCCGRQMQDAAHSRYPLWPLSNAQNVQVQWFRVPSKSLCDFWQCQEFEFCCAWRGFRCVSKTTHFGLCIFSVFGTGPILLFRCMLPKFSVRPADFSRRWDPCCLLGPGLLVTNKKVKGCRSKGLWCRLVSSNAGFGFWTTPPNIARNWQRSMHRRWTFDCAVFMTFTLVNLGVWQKQDFGFQQVYWSLQCFDKTYMQTMRIDFAVFLMLMPFLLLIFQLTHLFPPNEQWIGFGWLAVFSRCAWLWNAQDFWSARRSVSARTLLMCDRTLPC